MFQESDDVTLDNFYTGFFDRISKVILERQSLTGDSPSRSAQGFELNDSITADLQMVLDEHKAKTSDLISQKIEENMEEITHLRALLIAEEQKVSEERKRNE